MPIGDDEEEAQRITAAAQQRAAERLGAVPVGPINTHVLDVHTKTPAWERQSGYPEGATPADCIAADVAAYIAETQPRIGGDLDGLRCVIDAFYRACLSRGGVVTHIDSEWLWIGRGVQTIAVANGPGWTCCLAAGEFGAGVLVPRIEVS
jgi:hypothetical protein